MQKRINQREVRMGERLTWGQIQQKYPDQWIGIVDVEYEPDNVFQLGVVGG